MWWDTYPRHHVWSCRWSGLQSMHHATADGNVGHIHCSNNAKHTNKTGLSADLVRLCFFSVFLTFPFVFILERSHATVLLNFSFVFHSESLFVRTEQTWFFTFSCLENTASFWPPNIFRILQCMLDSLKYVEHGQKSRITKKEIKQRTSWSFAYKNSNWSL